MASNIHVISCKIKSTFPATQFAGSLIKKRAGTVYHSAFTQDDNLKTQSVQFKATWVIVVWSSIHSIFLSELNHGFKVFRFDLIDG